MFKDKILLITGGTGSFGNAVLDGFLDSEVKEIRIFSRDEKKQDDMRVKYQNEKIKFYIGNTRDYNSILSATVGVDYIFQQLPSCEFFPMEAVKTNIEGTFNVIKASVANGVKKVICLSTDKAVYPINAMGMSKALMEKVAIAESRNIPNDKTIVCCTRYGNVMASRGSVIPLFFKQANAEKPLTITDPNMTRFMMSLQEAVDLVLYAFKKGEQGDLFVQKSPASTVEDVAKAVKEISNSNSQIRIIGTRHGEKLYETLLTKEEFIKSEDLGDYFRVPADNRDLNYSQYEIKGGSKDLSKIEDYNSHNTKRLSLEETKEKILSLKNIKNVINGKI